MDLRGSSTALDTVVFVLLVGTAVAILAGANPQEPDATGRVADETADVLATSTTTVEFQRSATVQDGKLLRVIRQAVEGDEAATRKSIAVERRAHGTYAELLAAAAVADPTIGSEPLTGTGSAMDRSVTNATRRALPRNETNVKVLAQWRPYPDASLTGTMAVGDTPPRDADVSVATVSVASGFPNATRTLSTEPEYDEIARAVARSVIEGLFPPDRTADAMASEGPDRAIVSDRYRTAAGVLGVDISSDLGTADVETANAALIDRLAAMLRADLEDAFDSPTEAVEALSVDRVRIVVRTWS